jgi:regulatory protein
MGTRRRRHREPDPGDRDLGPPADPEAVARTIVLTKLTAQARSRHELADALTAKDVPVEVADAVLDRFEAVGLVDDSAFADAWVRSRSTGRGLSRAALRHELRRKGVSEEVIGESLEQLGPDAELDAARRLVERKLRSTRHLPTDVRFRRLVGLLARKGYPSGVSMRVVRQAIEADGAVDAVVGQVPAADQADTAVLDRP